MPRISQTFRNHEERLYVCESVAYSDDGGRTWRWESNDSPCPLHSCKSYQIPCDEAAQAQLISDHLDEFARKYHEAQARMTPEQEAEHAFELRAAFGPGKEIVDVLTGKITRT